MPSEGLENPYDMFNIDSLLAPPVVHHLHTSSSMESLGSEGMLQSATPEMNSSFEDAEMTWDLRHPYHQQSGMAQELQK